MNKRSLSERDICTKFITPALRQAGWDEMLQIREEVGFTKGRIIVRGRSRTQERRHLAYCHGFFRNSGAVQWRPRLTMTIVVVLQGALRALGVPKETSSCDTGPLVEGVRFDANLPAGRRGVVGA